MLKESFSLLALFWTILSNGQACTGSKRGDLDRIDYQIPLNHDYLQGNTRARIAKMMNDLETMIEDHLFPGQIEIQSEFTKEWLMTDRTRTAVNNDRSGNSIIPDTSSISLKNCVQTTWSHIFLNNDPERYQYQNDLTFRMDYHDPACDEVIGAKSSYKVIEKNHVLTTVMTDPCCFCDEVQGLDERDNDLGHVNVDIKLEFDDVNDYGRDCTNQIQMASERDFQNWPFNCQEWTGIGQYYEGMCKLYADANEVDFTVTDSDLYNYIYQYVFIVNAWENGAWVQVSEGKIAANVRYDTRNRYDNDRPSMDGTELLVQAFDSKTPKGYWGYTTDVLSELTDKINDCGYPYVRYPYCAVNSQQPGCPPTQSPTMAPTKEGALSCACSKIPGKKARWDAKCAGFATETKCGRTARLRKNCEWLCS